MKNLNKMTITHIRPIYPRFMATTAFTVVAISNVKNLIETSSERDIG